MSHNKDLEAIITKQINNVFLKEMPGIVNAVVESFNQSNLQTEDGVKQSTQNDLNEETQLIQMSATQFKTLIGLMVAGLDFGLYNSQFITDLLSGIVSQQKDKKSIDIINACKKKYDFDGIVSKAKEKEKYIDMAMATQSNNKVDNVHDRDSDNEKSCCHNKDGCGNCGNLNHNCHADINNGSCCNGMAQDSALSESVNNCNDVKNSGCKESINNEDADGNNKSRKSANKNVDDTNEVLEEILRLLNTNKKAFKTRSMNSKATSRDDVDIDRVSKAVVAEAERFINSLFK